MRVNVLFSVLLAAALPQAALAQKTVGIAGAGAIECGEFVKNKDKLGAPSFFAQWSMGYISSYNFFAEGAHVRVPEESTILLHAEKHCRANPLDHYINATSALIDELGGNSEKPKLQQPKK